MKLREGKTTSVLCDVTFRSLSDSGGVVATIVQLLLRVVVTALCEYFIVLESI